MSYKELESYKDLNVYQIAYKLAIEIHRYVEKNESTFSSDEISQLKAMSRDIIGDIAEGFSQRTPKAKRFFNFKALDSLHRLQLDIDYLHDTQRLPDTPYTDFYNGYEQLAKMLYKTNQKLIEKQTS